MTYEYLEVVVKGYFVTHEFDRKLDGTLPRWPRYLNDHGSQGWELIIKTPFDSRMNDGTDFTATFRRSK